MAKIITYKNKPALFHRVLLFVFFGSLFFSFRALTSISLGAMLIAGIAVFYKSPSLLTRRKTVLLFLVACFLCFLFQCISLLYTSNIQQGWVQIRLQTGVLLTPIAIYGMVSMNGNAARQSFTDACFLLLIASLYCVVLAVSRFIQTGNSSLLFYHALVSPLHQHAVFFSVYVFAALVVLMERIRAGDEYIKKEWLALLVIYFSFFLFLLSSKLVIAFYMLFLVYYFTVWQQKRHSPAFVSWGLLLLVVLPAALVLITRNPISNRFTEIAKTDMDMLRQDQYSPADYFNGLQFRLLQWKLVPKILGEQHAWLTGVGAGDARDKLDEQYRKKKMYTGDLQRQDRGFLGYNTHNQFLQSLLQNGAVGLLLFLFCCFTAAKLAWQTKSPAAVFITGLLLAFALTESVFETQYGIILFTGLPLLFSLYNYHPAEDRKLMKNLSPQA